MSPKTKEQFAVIRNKSEEKILSAALELFVEKGFKATSISSIAERAKISKGLLYNYYDSKTDLLRAIVTRASEIGTGIFDEVMREYDSPQEELEHLVLNVLEHVKTHTNYWYLLTSLSFQPEVMKEIHDIVNQNSKWSIEKGTELFQSMGSSEPFEDSMLFGAALDGLIMHYLHLREHYPIDRIAQKLIATYSIHSRQI